MKKIGQHTCTPPNSIQFRKFTKPPEASTFFLSIVQFPPLAFSSSSSIFFSFLLHSSLIFSSLLTYSLLFYLSYREQVFYIVHCNFVYFSPLGDPLDQGLVPVGESIKSINQSINQSLQSSLNFRNFSLLEFTVYRQNTEYSEMHASIAKEHVHVCVLVNLSN